VDYKDFDEELLLSGDEAQETPVSYLPLSFSYNGSLPDSMGVTQFSAGLNMAFRHLVTDQQDFQTKRFKARGNYLYATLGVERIQKLPAGFGIFIKLDGQLASEPLISNEQYIAGGMESVRGYKENEEAGDDAVHGTIEISAPNLAKIFKKEDWFTLIPYLFFDGAYLNTQDPLPGQAGHAKMTGTGAGIHGLALDGLEYEVVWGLALESTDRTDSGDMKIYFRIKYGF
jgi:hemolysin activation/secretion protein